MVLALSGAASAVAAEDPTTTVSGVVTAEDTGLPLAGVSVFVNSTDFSSNGADSTNADGTYAVADLEPGEYTVRFAADTAGTDYVSEYWNGVHDWSSATRITAVGGEDIADVDASLVLGGSISGTVTRADDASPVAGVTVSFVSDAGGETRSATTDAAGHYRSFGLLPASYSVRFDSPDEGLADEYWNGAPDQWSATRVLVVSGQETTGVDASLAGVATIAGSVTLADGSPATGSVSVSGPDTAGASVPISADGSYRLPFAPGSVTVYFQSDDPRVLSEYWEDAGSPEAATPVSVSSGQTVVLDAQLEAAGVVSGVVRGEDGPLYDAIVVASKDGQVAGMAYTKSDGSYSIPLPAGTYTVRAESGYGPGAVHAPQYFDHAATWSEATAITLVSGAEATGTDFDLTVGGDIAGTVWTDDGGVVAADVVAYLWSGGQWREVARTETNGVYSFSWMGAEAGGGVLPAGTYRIGVEADGYCPQFYRGAFDIRDGASIDLASGNRITGVDVELVVECVVPETEPSIALDRSSVEAGGTVVVTGERFQPGEVVEFELHSDAIALGTLTADADGRVAGSLTIPASAPVGAHTLVALHDEGGVQASAALQVTARSGSGASGSGPTGGGAVTALAATGAELPVAAVALGAVLAVFGAALVRRRRVS